MWTIRGIGAQRTNVTKNGIDVELLRGHSLVLERGLGTSDATCLS
jgi:hypothetical protein